MEEYHMLITCVKELLGTNELEIKQKYFNEPLLNILLKFNKESQYEICYFFAEIDNILINIDDIDLPEKYNLFYYFQELQAVCQSLHICICECMKILDFDECKIMFSIIEYCHLVINKIINDRLQIYEKQYNSLKHCEQYLTEDKKYELEFCKRMIDLLKSPFI